MGGLGGLLLAAALGTALSIALDFIIGHTLNRVRGQEMIVTIIIGLLAICIYQFTFLAGYGSVIPCHNPEIILSRGIGVRSMVDVSPQAGQNILSNAAFGEYFRSFVAYGTIAFALMMNIRQDKGK